LADKTAGVLAEGPHFVTERQRVADQLALVKSAVDFLHHLIAHFNAHADINGAGLVGDAVLFTELLQPVGSAPPGSDDGGIRRDLKALPAARFFHMHAQADPVLEDQVGAAVAKEYLYALVDQVTLDGPVNLLRLL